MKPVKFYSFHCNRPDLIKIQRDSLDRFIRDTSWELVIINNSHSTEHRRQISDECLKNNLKEIILLPTLGPGFAHAEAMNAIWQKHMLSDKGHYSAFLDGDMFSIADFSVNDFMDGGHVFGDGKCQREYVWHWLSPLLLIADIDNIPEGETINWIGGVAPNGCTLDTGGGFHRYLNSHEFIKDKVKSWNYSWYINAQNNNKHLLPDELRFVYQDSFEIEIINDCFLHYARSSNYDNKDNGFHSRKTSFVKAFVYACISDKIKMKKSNFMIPNDSYFGWGKWV